MTRVYLRLITALIALSSVLASTVISAKAQVSGTDTYAITNARIVTVSGPVIERGTIVIRDGIIAAVGANVTVPADARVIDGAGLTVYPGLIDSSTTLGIPQPSPSPSPSPGGATQGAGQFRTQTISIVALNSSEPPGLQPEIRAEDYIKPGGDQIEAARNVGITTALTVPRQGIWMGQSALINLAGDTPQQMIVRPSVAMHVSFTPLRTGSYPNSLLGVFAVVRQMMLDSLQYREAVRASLGVPHGRRRLDNNNSLAVLIPVVDGHVPLVMYADREREIIRALDLAKEFKLRDIIIAGGMESEKVIDRLREGKVPVLLSLNFPRRTTMALPEADPEPIRVLRERVAAPKTAGKLAAAGVKFAFQSGALTNQSDFIVNVRRAIENGLSRQDALRALTISPAEILGVAGSLGTLDEGKIANLTITRGDLFDQNSKVAYVFIDGRPVELRPATPATSTGNAAGSWALSIDFGKGKIAVTLLLEQEGERLRGSIQGGLGSNEIANASVPSGGDIRFTVPATFEGQTAEATFTGKITDNEMQGTVNVVGREPGTFSGTRLGTPSAVPRESPTPPGGL